MEAVKGVSSRALNEAFERPAWSFKWQGSYSDHSVSASHMTRVRLYIENQKQHHADISLWPACELPAKSEAREGGDLPI